MKEIPLTKGKVALVDDCDYPALSRFRWFYHNRGYAFRQVRSAPGPRKTILMHRAVLELAGIGPGSRTDHRNGNGLDNCRENLRPATAVTNGRNRRPNNGKKYKGVSRNGNGHRARITVAGQEVTLGTYPTEEQAARAYDAAAREHFAEFAHPNFDEVLAL